MHKRTFNTVPVLAILTCFFWSTAFVGIKIGLESAPPFFFAGIRYIISGLILLPFCGKPSVFLREIRSHIKTVVLVSLFQTFLLYA